MEIDAKQDRKRGRWRRMWGYTVNLLEAMDFGPMEYTESRISRLEQEVAALKTTAYFAQTAKEASLECVVNMSQKSACEDAPSHAAQDHWLSEQAFDWSG
jgi:hypothetical protein